jgi:hypothetical protein
MPFLDLRFPLEREPENREKEKCAHGVLPSSRAHSLAELSIEHSDEGGLTCCIEDDLCIEGNLRDCGSGLTWSPKLGLWLTKRRI